MKNLFISEISFNALLIETLVVHSYNGKINSIIWLEVDRIREVKNKYYCYDQRSRISKL